MALPMVVAVGDDTADTLTPLIKALRVGPGIRQGAEENEMGPVVSAAHQKKGLGYIDKGEQEGAKLVVDGRAIRVAGHEEGYYVGGTLFDGVTSGMVIWREEIFGPVLSIMRAADFDSALKLVNSHEFGNGSAIFTRNGHTARAFVQNVEAGMTGVNVPVPVPMAFHSFGGWKRSVFGALNVHGLDGVRFYTRMKTTTVRWPGGQQTVIRVQHANAGLSLPKQEGEDVSDFKSAAARSEWTYSAHHAGKRGLGVWGLMPVCCKRTSVRSSAVALKSCAWCWSPD